MRLPSLRVLVAVVLVALCAGCGSYSKREHPTAPDFPGGTSTNCNTYTTLAECVGSTSRTQVIYEDLIISSTTDVVSLDGLEVQYTSGNSREVLMAALVNVDGTRNFNRTVPDAGSGHISQDFGSVTNVPPGTYDVILIWVDTSASGYIGFGSGRLRLCSP